MISIIIPVFNGEKTLIDTIKSIEKQTFQNFEVIIVNDGSTDKTALVFEKFAIKNKLINDYYFINQSNKGAPAARNRGFKESRGSYLFFCDDDAVLRPDALEVMLRELSNNPSAAYVYPSFYWGRRLFKLWPFSVERLKKMPYIHTMALIKRERFPDTGWDESIKKFQDWDLWLTMMENGQYGFFIDEPLFKIKTGGGISSWLPSFSYKYLPFLKTVKKYNKAMAIIKEKHKLL